MRFRKIIAASLAAVVATASIGMTAGAEGLQTITVSNVAYASKVTTKSITLNIGASKTISTTKINTKSAVVKSSRSSVVKATYTKAGKLKLTALKAGTSTVSLYKGSTLVAKYKVTVRDTLVDAIAKYKMPENALIESTFSVNILDDSANSNYFNVGLECYVLNGYGVECTLDVLDYEMLECTLDNSGIYLNMSKTPEALTHLAEWLDSADAVDYAAAMREFATVVSSVMPMDNTAVYITYDDMLATDTTGMLTPDVVAALKSDPVNAITAYGDTIVPTTNTLTLRKDIMSIAGSKAFSYKNGIYTMKLTATQTKKLITNMIEGIDVALDDDFIVTFTYKPDSQTNGYVLSGTAEGASSSIGFSQVVSELPKGTLLRYPDSYIAYADFVNELVQAEQPNIAYNSIS